MVSFPLPSLPYFYSPPSLSAVQHNQSVLISAVNSVVSSMNFAKKVPPEHQLIEDLVNGQEAFGDFLGAAAISDFIPALRPLLEKPENLRIVKHNFQIIGKTMREMIAEHKFNPGILDVQVQALKSPSSLYQRK